MPAKVDQRYTKAETYYRLADDPDESCGVCKYFRKRADYDNGTCELVKGIIEPEDTCDLWEAAPVLGGMGVAIPLGILGALWFLSRR